MLFVLAPSSGAARLAAKSCTKKHKVTTCVFNYTHHPVKWVVPTGVTAVTVTVEGAQGGASAHNGTGGLGGEATANLAVKPGSGLQVDVGGAGSASTGGWNGGRNGGADPAEVSTGGGGGGASDVRAGKCVAKLTCTMAQAVLVAGGGGGGGDAAIDPSHSNFAGAAGGGLDGGTAGGGGGTQTAGGGGTGGCNGGTNGALGQGGAGGASYFSSDQDVGCVGGAGGGGGYYGGGGTGSSDGYVSQGGGGGSGFGPAGSTRVTFASGVQSGNGTVSITYPVAKTAPTIATADSAQFPTGVPSSFEVTTGPTEWPIPKLKVVGSLPAGVTLVDKHDGTATLAGEPTAAVAGSYSFQIVAANGVAPQAVQNFTLVVGAAPQITSSDLTTWRLGQPGTFTVTTSGDPAPALITETGALPSGVTFHNNGDGTATFSGTPDENNGPVLGGYPITLKASQTGGGSWPPATQSLLLDVLAAPQYVNFEVNSSGTDSMPLNPGFGLAVNGTPCTNDLSGTETFIECFRSSFGNMFEQGFLIGGRECGSDDLPLQTTLALSSCFSVNGIAWDPADHLTLTAPATTTAGDTTYDFLFWDTSGQAVACDGGNTSEACSFDVPSSGVDINAVYLPVR